MKFESKGLISLDINGIIYDYKLYQSLESLSRTKSQRKSAKELNISHTVFNRRLLKAEVRIIIYVIIIASVVTCVQLCMQAYTAELYEALGLYISLIVTNCIIIARAEIFASRNSVFYSALDGFANGLGFTAVLLFIGGVREIIGKGTLFSGMDQLIGESGRNLQINIFSADDGLLIAILPPGAFITLGLLVAAKNYLDNRLYIKNSSKKRDSESTIVTE